MPPRRPPPAPPPFDPARAGDHPAAIGCDEVGRGALSGPVVVAAVWFDPAAFPPALLAALDDSKRVPGPVRETLSPLIRAHARVALAAGSPALIDRLNIRGATLDAMARAVARLRRDPTLTGPTLTGPAPTGPAFIDAPVLVDGRDAIPGVASRPVVGGDRLVPQIAAASIVAKVFRDRLMRRLARAHPGYGWERNVGYGTPDHRAGLARLGRCPHHRLSFTRGFS